MNENESRGGAAPLTYDHTFTLTAGDCDCARRMPLALLLRRVIEVATLHANRLHIGWTDLAPMNIGWVLSRVHLHLDRFPRPNEVLTLRTWVEDFTRMYSNRAFSLIDAQGREIGQALSMWVCIDLKARTAADITALHGERFINTGLKCTLPRMRKLPSTALDAATLVDNYRFMYSDLDFNGHVNSARYAEAVLNLWDPAVYRAYEPRDFEINYLHECLFGERATIAADEVRAEDGTMTATVTLWREDTPCVNARVTFVPAKDAEDAPVPMDIPDAEDREDCEP